MAVGDAVADIQSIATTAYLDIQPGSGAEWVIHNIYHESDVTVERYDGTNALIFATEIGAGSINFANMHCNNTDRIRVKNINAASKLIGYDGIVTK